MKQLVFILIIFSTLLGGCTTSADKMMSPNNIVLSKSQTKLYVADETANRISILNTENSVLERHIPLEGKPGGLALSADEHLLFVTLSEAQGKLLEIDLTKDKIIRTLELGHSPLAPVLSSDNQSLFLCNHFSNSINKINLSTFEIEVSAKTDREPTDIALYANEERLLVSNHLPSGEANAAYHSAKVSVFNAATLELVDEISLPNGSNSLNKIEVSADEQFAYVTHILARYNVPTNQVERGWINTNALSVIDLKNTSYLCTIMLDDLDLGAANPYAVICSEDGKSIFVSHTGTNELSIIDREKLHQRIDNVSKGIKSSIYANSLEEIQNDLSFLQDIRKRVDLNDLGAKGLAATKDKVFVSMYFSGSISEIDIANPNEVNSISLGNQADPSLERLGEIYFNDASICKQHWQSCVSCHPGNARVDGLNWDLLNDGIGNPKNTKSMLLAHATPPAMITGIRENSNLAVRAGIEHILFTHQAEEIAIAMDAYLSALTPVPSPYLDNGELTEAGERGKVLFEKAKCSLCHSGPYYTNMKAYDIGEGSGMEEGQLFDTPSLIEVWRTAPYLYDGKAKTIKDVLTKYNRKDMHGITSRLSVEEVDDLAVYVLSL